MLGYYIGYFFFQAEDGIRDDLVTGVQTCALPISEPSAVNDSRGPFVPPAGPWGVHTPKPANRIPSPPRNQAASDSESPARSRKLPHRSGRSRRRGRIARGFVRLGGRIGMPSHGHEQ